MRSQIIERLRKRPEIERVTYLHVEYVGPQRLFVVAAVDLKGDDRESDLAIRFRALEAEIEKATIIEDIVLTLLRRTSPTFAPSLSPTGADPFRFSW